MKKSLLSTIVVALLAAVIVVSSTITVQAERQSADEKADSQAAKEHTKQADNACQKDGYDGYINDNCGYLN
jgi:CHASE3 domain sensor protein